MLLVALPPPNMQHFSSFLKLMGKMYSKMHIKLCLIWLPSLVQLRPSRNIFGILGRSKVLDCYILCSGKVHPSSSTMYLKTSAMSVYQAGIFLYGAFSEFNCERARNRFWELF